MFGSSSTTRRRASGAVLPAVGLPDTVPPVGRANAVMDVTLTVPTAVSLDATCELPEETSVRRRHAPAAPPVPDRVVLRTAETPATAQVGADGPDGAGLGGHPGEDVVLREGVQRSHGIGEQRALPGRGPLPVQPVDGDARRPRQWLFLLGARDLDQGDAAGVVRCRG